MLKGTGDGNSVGMVLVLEADPDKSVISNSLKTLLSLVYLQTVSL